MAEVIIKIFLGIYSFLMLSASILIISKESKESKKLTSSMFHIYNITFSIIFILSIFILPWNFFVIVAIIILVLYQLLAIYRGTSMHDFLLEHHIIRLVITLIFIIFLILI